MDKSKTLEIMNRGYFGAEPDEKEVLEHLPSILAHVRVFVDVGAALGQYTFHVNKYIRGGEIFAVEADPLRFDVLEDNCCEWGPLTDNKLHAVHAALSDLDGETHFYTTNSPVSGGLFMHDVSHVSEEGRKAITWEEITVKSPKLDTLVEAVGADLVKIDVEGGELRVLRGATRLLREGKAKFLIEVHSWLDPEGQSNSADVYDFMKSFRYYPIDFYGHELFVKRNTLWLIGFKLRMQVRWLARRILPRPMRQWLGGLLRYR